ncbi:hypothetical protein R1sor_022542 [Riccia sorocarpa]|uniref:Uncharacterized protein n=1 Tax=Riccia sorocarpa TaxID=122646 RepID=A0ABD3GNZ8_9MARC
MANLEKLQFPPLESDGGNYLFWSTMVRNHLTAETLTDTIADGYDPGTNNDQRARAAKSYMFIIRHLAPDLQLQYINTTNPTTVWRALRLQFDNLRDTLQPTALCEWENLRFSDYKSVSEYNLAFAEGGMMKPQKMKKITRGRKIARVLATSVAQTDIGQKIAEHQNICL